MVVEPVIAADEHTYERAAIQEWLLTHSTSPVTVQPLPHTRLVPNFLVKTGSRCMIDDTWSHLQIPQANSFGLGYLQARPHT